ETVPFIPLGLIAVGIATALGAAQLAVINAQPLPQLNKGKRPGEFEGFAEVAERKPEIVKKDGRMYLVKEPSVMWIGQQDTVFKPSETVEMLEGMTFGKNRITDAQSSSRSSAVLSLDYEKFGKAVSDNIP